VKSIRSVTLRVAAGGIVLALPLLIGCASSHGARPLTALPSAATPTRVPQLDIEYLGMSVLPGKLEFRDTPVGGLSGIRYDATLGSYLAVSDDPSARGPARVYRLETTSSDGAGPPDDIRITDMIPLRRADGSTFAPDTIDPEGIAIAPDGSFYVSSEGNVGQGIGPAVFHFAADGALLGELAVPPHFMPNDAGTRGIRQNTGFEALTLTPDGNEVIVGTESALIQDGPFSSSSQGSPSRLLVFDRRSGRETAEYIYPVGRVRRHSTTPGGLTVKGLTELLALDDSHLLALERSYVAGQGDSVQLNEIDLGAADDVSGIESLKDADLSSLKPVAKHQLLDFASLGVPLDNLEGMALGPTLPDGRRVLLVISDNNFDWRGQISEFLCFAVKITPGTTE